MPVYKTVSERETVEVAAQFARTLKPGDSVALQGDLGAGKSVFCRAVIRTLCDDPDLLVPSPTFPLVQTYDAPGDVTLWHFDLYRLEDPAEIFELGWEEALAGGISLIEWPERAGDYLPGERYHISLKEGERGTREIIIGGP